MPTIATRTFPNVGFPTATDIMVSRTDYAEMLAFIDDLKDWIRAASGCLAGQR